MGSGTVVVAPRRAEHEFLPRVNVNGNQLSNEGEVWAWGGWYRIPGEDYYYAGTSFAATLVSVFAATYSARGINQAIGSLDSVIYPECTE